MRIATAAHPHPMNLPALKTHRGHARQTLQRLRRGEACPVRSQLAHQPWGQFAARSRQRTKQIMIGMLLEKRFDGRAIFVELPAQHLQHFRETHRQPAFGAGDGRAAFPVRRMGEECQPFLRRLRSPQLVDVEKLFPFSFAGLGQFLRRGELHDQRPGRRQRPIFKRLQGRVVILAQRRAQLVDQRGALLDQRHFVPAQQTQFLDHRVFRHQGPPTPSVQPQSIGQCPGVELVVFDAAGRFALAVTRRRFRLHGKHRAIAAQQLLHGCAAAGFNRHAQAGISLGLLAELFPALGTVLEPKLCDPLSCWIHDDDIVVITGPIETGVVRQFIPIFHRLSFRIYSRRVVPGRPQADTRALAGRCSLRGWPGATRRHR